MNPEITESGRLLERQVAEIMQLLAGIEIDLSEIGNSPEAERACRELSRRRATIAATIGKLQHGQAEVERQLEEHVSELARREAALEASRVQLRSLTRRLVQVQENERLSLARDLHDTASQGMSVLGLGLSILKRERGLVDTSARIDELQNTLAAVSEDLHRLSAHLRPSALDRYGLVPAVEELVAGLRDQAGIEVAYQVEGLDDRVPGDVETALYRIVQEACTNITRYAAASRASVAVRRERDTVRVSVQDDGQGFDPAEALSRGGLGLLGMRERAEMLGGAFILDSSPGHGTRVQVEVPVAGVAPESRSVAPVQPRVGRADPAVSFEVGELARIQALSDAMLDITAGIPRIGDLDELLTFVLGRAAGAIGCDYALIALRKSRRWIVSHAYGLPEAMIRQRLIPAAVPLALEIERTGEAVVVNDTQARDPLAIAARESGVFSGAGMPLVVADGFLGVFACAHISEPVAFRPSEVAFLRHLSNVISLVLEIIQLRSGDRKRAASFL